MKPESRVDVSVVIPTHNHAHFLPQTLESVKKQTYAQFEVIVVDNGSTDNTRDVISRLQWDKLRYCYRENSGSAAAPRNTGIAMARGEFVAFLDSDDVWYKDKLSKVMEVAQRNPGIDVICNDEYIRENGSLGAYLSYGPAEPEMFETLLFKGNRLSGSATTVRTTSLRAAGGFDERKKFVHVEDYELWLRLAKAGANFYFLKESLGEYVIHDTNLSHDITLHMKNLRNVLLEHFGSFEKKLHPRYAAMFCECYAKTYYSQFLRYMKKRKIAHERRGNKVV